MCRLIIQIDEQKCWGNSIYPSQWAGKIRSLETRPPDFRSGGIRSRLRHSPGSGMTPRERLHLEVAEYTLQAFVGLSLHARYRWSRRTGNAAKPQGAWTCLRVRPATGLAGSGLVWECEECKCVRWTRGTPPIYTTRYCHNTPRTHRQLCLLLSS